MIESYFKRPILYDYIVAFIIIAIILTIDYTNVIINNSIIIKSYDFSSDIGAIGLTISGFILTLVTILITLKSGQIISDEELKNDSSLFKIFLASNLYFKSLRILKNGVLSLIAICFLIYVLKLILTRSYYIILFYTNLVALLIIITTFLRCFYVLNLIMKMQKK
ncbi:MAG: hypothetical protein CMH15_09600 [Mesonia sp.]|uniref:Uncharacterized protein n=1 Tax=Mesonia oceanica TaxID=2687242 RepID=A0AC61Y3E0_9FLAO|nr:hypothetical protein [Mesonia sp.]MAQ41280.1 hypothetical protein [Mesonia sp.]MBJ97379.1 hypothetical protein [Flavobacteriaceae bacterium]VVU98853.1 hypothetical protein FVB9532_00101 [Mesonia oceanica]|tara:strand:- start:79427 stop:79921 length:495 start_codon:yes stop_codon:yes gene_type:complete